MTEPFLSISDVGRRLDIPAHTLRYWEKQFPAAIKPTTGAGGRRYYRGDVVKALAEVKDLLYNRGMTIAGVKKLIADGTFEKALSNTESVDVIDSANAPEKIINSDIHGPEFDLSDADATEISHALDLMLAAKAALE